MSVAKGPKATRWVFGLLFKGTPVDLLSLTCDILKLFDIVILHSSDINLGVANHPQGPEDEMPFAH